MSSSSRTTVLITGADGNLGAKIADSFSASVEGVEVRTLHSPDYPTDKPHRGHAVSHTGCDLRILEDRWTRLLDGVDVVIHFAAQNPIPQSSWADAIASFDMTANLLRAAEHAGVRRFVFSSSNHVMGRYKDSPLAQTIGPGLLTEKLTPAPGTRWFNGTEMVDATPYAASKLMGERLVGQVAGSSQVLREAVSVRVGWAQPGNNDPANISISGTGTPDQAATSSDPDADANLKWFRDMWLSNTDLDQLFHAAAFCKSDHWPSNHIVINGVSANEGSPWSAVAGHRLIGYAPSDNIYDHVRRQPGDSP